MLVLFIFCMSSVLGTVSKALLMSIVASCVSGVSVYVLFRVRMSLQSLEELIWYEIVLKTCLHFVCCSCRTSLFISLFSICMRLMIFDVGRWYLR